MSDPQIQLSNETGVFVSVDDWNTLNDCSDWVRTVKAWVKRFEEQKARAEHAEGEVAQLRQQQKALITNWRHEAAINREVETTQSTLFDQGEYHGYGLCYDECADELEQLAPSPVPAEET